MIDGICSDRLSEFADTPASDLTSAEFESIDFEDVSACDPPAFTRARRNEQLKALVRDTVDV